MTGLSKNPATYQRQLDVGFEILLNAALAGTRCPTNDTRGLSSSVVTALAREGKIRVEVFAHNWRVVTITEGLHAGACTQAHPTSKTPYVRVDKNGTWRGGWQFDKGASSRPQPSKPGLIPYTGKRQ
jgi:hypothetical protein